jgi:hypothetical protein
MILPMATLGKGKLVRRKRYGGCGFICRRWPIYIRNLRLEIIISVRGEGMSGRRNQSHNHRERDDGDWRVFSHFFSDRL